MIEEGDLLVDERTVKKGTPTKEKGDLINVVAGVIHQKKS